jgi:hypothetical protein
MCNSCDWTDDHWGQLRTKNYQRRIYNCFTIRLVFVCYQMQKSVLYLLCVLSAIVQTNFLVKSRESTFIVATCNKHVTIWYLGTGVTSLLHRFILEGLRQTMRNLSYVSQYPAGVPFWVRCFTIVPTSWVWSRFCQALMNVSVMALVSYSCLQEISKVFYHTVVLV